jgi:hypothetical protein
MQSSNSMSGKERTMEDLKYQYVTMHYPNVIARLRKDEEKLDCIADPKIKPLIDALALKYPNWRLVGRSAWRKRAEDKHYEISRFGIFEKRELLGELTTSWSRKHGDVYVIENNRIAQARERGSAARTKDLAKAMKLVAKTFGVKTLFEMMAEAKEEADGVVHQVYGDRRSRFDRAYSGITHMLASHIMSNWETFAPIAVANGADASVVDKLPEFYNEYQITKDIYSCGANNGRGVVVLIHGSDYAVLMPTDTGDSKLVTFSSDDLPLHIKVAVGMLKLVENKYFIKDVGVRINENTFFVTKEAEHE